MTESDYIPVYCEVEHGTGEVRVELESDTSPGDEVMDRYVLLSDHEKTVRGASQKAPKWCDEPTVNGAYWVRRKGKAMRSLIGYFSLREGTRQWRSPVGNLTLPCDWEFFGPLPEPPPGRTK